MYQLSDETSLWQAISNLQEAIERKDDNEVDKRMAIVDAEFSRIALQTNPNLASDQEKYKREIAAKAAADAKPWQPQTPRQMLQKPMNTD